jgi:hypothetical protein|tara:strand:+ start:872 stop:1339 length:468 start_codon:yes stop_codon:yes gene_type:complete
MNIFYLDNNPKLCAEYHCDKHVVKMILETAQLLCTTHWVCGNVAPYKKTHVNHPSNKWVRESLSNYVWLCDLGMELCKEYTYRYGKTHKTQQHIEWAMCNLPVIIDLGFTEVPQAMPDECKRVNSVDAYREYYNVEKAYMCKWKNREVPYWFKDF